MEDQLIIILTSCFWCWF